MNEGVADSITLCTAVPYRPVQLVRHYVAYSCVQLCTAVYSCVQLCTAVYSWCNVANGLSFTLLSDPARAAQGPLYAREGGGMFLFPATAEVGAGPGRIVAPHRRPST